MKLHFNIDTYKHKVSEESFFSKINLELHANNLAFLIGLSGIGKTTFLRILLGLSEGYFKGKISYEYDGNSFGIKKVKMEGLIAYQSQTPALVPWETIENNINLPSKLNDKLQKPSRDVLVQLLRRLGLERDILLKYPHELSFGMRSRIEFLRTIIYKPKFIFLDELFTGLDSLNCDIIGEVLKEEIKAKGLICLCITHNIERAVNLADNIYILNSNRCLSKISRPWSIKNILNLLKN